MTPVASPCFRFICSAPDTIVVEGEKRRSIFQNKLLFEIFELLDGKRSEDQIVSMLNHTWSSSEIYYSLGFMSQRGLIEYLGEGETLQASAESIFWRLARNDVSLISGLAVQIVSLGSLGQREFQEAFSAAAIDVSDTASFSVVLVDNYLNSGLPDWNAKQVRTGQPWLLVKPVGINLIIGPLFVPGKTGCWQCLEHRFRAGPLYRDLRTRELVDPPMAATPSSLSVAANLTCIEVAAMLKANRGPSLLGELVHFDLSSFSMTRERITRRTHCKVCGTEQHALGSLRASESNQSASIDYVSQNIGELAGPVRKVERIEVKEIPDAHVYTAAVNHLQLVDVDTLVSRNYVIAAAGKGFTANQARDSAVFEALERYSAIFEEPSSSVKASALSLGNTAIVPSELYSFSDTQFSRRQSWNEIYRRFQPIPEPFDLREEIHWTPVRAINEQVTKYVPTAYAFFHVPKEKDTRACVADSNGIAAAPSFEEAVLRGLLELIERDAVGIWWYNRLSAPRLRVELVESDRLKGLWKSIQSAAREVEAYVIPTDVGVPVVVVASWDRDQFGRGLALGFGCHPNPSAALHSALAEHNQKLPMVFSRDRWHDDGIHLMWRDIATFGSGHLEFLRPTKDLTLSEFAEVNPLREPTSVENVVDRLRALDLAAYVLDLSKPDIGLPVVRTIVPGMRSFWRRTGPGRLFDVPVRNRWVERAHKEVELNPITLVL